MIIFNKLRQYASLTTLSALIALPAYAAEKEQMMIIVDGSNSMWAQIDGTSRMEMTRNSIAALASGSEQTYDLGLVTFGGKRKGCNSVRVEAKVGQKDHAYIVERVQKLTPIKQAKSPITSSLHYASKQLPNGGRILLISDGKEACSGDPCRKAQQIKDKNPNIKVDVLGFSAEDEAQLQCIAQNTGGRFVMARNQGAIADVYSNLKPVINQQIDNGETKKPSAGNTIVDFQTTQTETQQQAAQTEAGMGILAISFGEASSDENLPSNFFIYTHNGDLVKHFTARSSVDATLPAGKYRVNALWKKFKKTQNVTIANNEKTILRFKIATRGKLKLQANTPEDKGISYVIYKKNGDFVNKSILQGNYETHLPEGQYRIKATYANDTTKEVSINLKSGAVLSHTFEF